MPAISIRPATGRDLPRLAEIYNDYMINTPVAFDIEPYTVERRAAWFNQFSSSGATGSLSPRKPGSCWVTRALRVFVPKQLTRLQSGRRFIVHRMQCRIRPAPRCMNVSASSELACSPRTVANLAATGTWPGTSAQLTGSDRGPVPSGKCDYCDVMAGAARR